MPPTIHIVIAQVWADGQRLDLAFNGQNLCLSRQWAVAIRDAINAALPQMPVPDEPQE